VLNKIPILLIVEDGPKTYKETMISWDCLLERGS
jgi:hypothetical protein